MTLTLNIVLLIASILTFVFVIVKIRKSQLQIADSIPWLLGAFFLIIISVFSKLIFYVANLLGFYSASNFILTVFIFFLLILSFTQNIKISILNEKLKNLNHYISLSEKKKDCDEKEQE